MASHFSVDLTKTAKIRCVNFNESDLITCFANDYGYKEWVRKAVEFYGDKGDVGIFISSSGKSPNIINGCYAAPIYSDTVYYKTQNAIIYSVLCIPCIFIRPICFN